MAEDGSGLKSSSQRGGKKRHRMWGLEAGRLLLPDYIVPAGANGPRVVATRNAGASSYNAVALQFQRRLSRGLQALASYTLARAFDRESDFDGGEASRSAWDHNYATSLSGIHVSPMAPADYDVRHSASGAISYALPSPAASTVASAMFGGWAVDAIVRSSSPPPLNVRIEGVSPELGAYKTQPDLVPGQPIWLSAANEPGGRILNPDAFTLPPVGMPGNLPRNSIRSPFGIHQTDLSVRRRFRAGGSGASLEFRADVFNVFNTAMFGGQFAPFTAWGRCTATPCTGRQFSDFGKVLYTLNEGLGGGGIDGGQSAIYAVGGPRSVQLSLKLLY